MDKGTMQLRQRASQWANAVYTAVLWFLDKAKHWVRYAYFLRFSLALWLFAPFLCLLDRWFTKTLTSGVMTPETMQQYLCVAFFLVSAGFVSLTCARVVLINGPQRWDKGYNKRNDGRPPRLTALLANDKAEWEWLALILSQAPNLIVYCYLFVNGTGQGVDGGQIIEGLFLGSSLAGIVWYVVNAWYYLTYDAPEPYGLVRFGRNAARTLLFPRTFWGFRLAQIGTPYSQLTLEGAATRLTNSSVDSFFRWIGRVLHVTPGYAYRPDADPDPEPAHDASAETLAPQAPVAPSAPLPSTRLYEGHIFGIVSALMFLGLYGLLWPLTAPVPAVPPSVACLILLLLFSIILALVILRTREHHLWRTGMIVVVALFFLAVLSLYLFSSAERFPILATVLIMGTALCWTLSGLAFFLDLYRVPVLTAFLLAMIAPRVLHCDHGREEHYLSVTTSPPFDAEKPPADDILLTRTPAVLLQQARNANSGADHPLIIVTATGGGLHASAWTAEVLYRLEQQFDRAYPDEKGTFHKHLLLVSTVSGGSIGLLNYLAALDRAKSVDTAEFESMRISAQCSSLEAIGWGLVYWDMSKAIVPFFPYFFKPSSGINDLDATPLRKDRTWSLRKSFARNLNNDFCNETWRRDQGSGFKTLWEQIRNDLKLRVESNYDAEKANRIREQNLTLRKLKPDWDKQPIPAFTMNTTSYEDGQRFLLANYWIPDGEQPDTMPNYKARSFLETYRTVMWKDEKDEENRCDNQDKNYEKSDASEKSDKEQMSIADLPLATAAQLSATFPYVSSAARVPRKLDHNACAVHFVDGGYYDNDGTSSVLEFLRYALAPCQNSNTEAERDDCRERSRNAPPTTPQPPQTRILLIEIRNSGDDYGSEPENNPYHTKANHPSNLFSQLAAPPTGFWQAGHESVTARTRVALAQVEHAFAGQLEIHRVVFADNRSTNEVGTDPLSWSLTPKQRREVRDSAIGCDLTPKYDEALYWFQLKADDWTKNDNADSNWPE